MLALVIGSLWDALSVAPRMPRHQWRAVLPIFWLQLEFTAWQALPWVLGSAFFLGMAAWIQTLAILGNLGLETTLCTIFVRALFREIAPLFTAFLVLGRSGTAIAAELANMHVNHEWEGLWLHGVDPRRYVLLPRLMAGAVSVVALQALFAWTAILGAYGATLFGTENILDQVVEALETTLRHADLALFLGKGLLNGLLVPLLAYAASEAARVVADTPKCVTKAVVVGSLVILFADVGLLFLVPP